MKDIDKSAHWEPGSELWLNHLLDTEPFSG
jgi:hypothetical protein